MAYFSVSLVVSFLLLGFCQAEIDPELVRSLGPFGRSDVLIDFNDGNTRAIRTIQGRTFRSRLSKAKALTKALRSQSDESQGPVQEYLEGQGIQSESFWSSNQMVLRKANLKTLRGVDSFPQVSKIQRLPELKMLSWSIPVDASGSNSTNGTVEWGLSMIGAEEVWSQFNTTGEGVVVANIDSGVRGTHEALAGNWRANRGWFDPYTFRHLPDDDNGHGTHTMGTIAGQGGIGVAPGATWIACRGCDNNGCDAAQLLACGQFMLRPTHPNGTEPDESFAPDIINNSWGSSHPIQQLNPWYNATIAAWTAAGIMHAFAIGNSGPLCFSTGNPGNQPETFSVGSTDNQDRLSIFSSKGPAVGIFGINTKPDISAPGENVRSAWFKADDSYSIVSGTSMACPHVAGVMALMLSAHRAQVGYTSAKLNFQTVIQDIKETAVREGLRLSTLNPPCDGLLSGGNSYPNNQFGYGRIDALKCVNATVSRGESSTEP